MKESPMKDNDKCLDSQLWHACAGGMVQMPAVNSKVYYFPQGHAEHAQSAVDFGTSPRIPPLILCRVTAVKFRADKETDEVFAKIQMVPISNSESDYGEGDGLGLSMNGFDAQEKPTSFAKTLTQSDANNGGGFSVPRYCAETIFPRLDYSADPPVQTVIAKDVHGEVWKFRHIYRGTPRRHLLTTGWSIFVNQKKLVAGDSIVFLRAENGDLCIGIRRAKRGGFGDGPETPGWNSPSESAISGYDSFSAFLREEESKLMRGTGGNFASSGGMRGRGRVRADAVIGTASLAASGQPFEVVYYPRAGTPEFCVKAASVRAAMRIQWCPGMRFKMAFETEDSSRISWFMGTISSVQVSDPVRWPISPWRLLQVQWDEPDFLQNVKCVNPWLVELVSHMPAINLAHFSPPSKKPRIPQHPDLPFEGIQGARHANFGLRNLHLSKLQMGLFHAGLHRVDQATPNSRISMGVIVGNPTVDDDLSCLLTIGHPSQNLKKSCNGKPPQLVLFGQPILTEQQVSLSESENVVSLGATGKSSTGGDLKKTTYASGGSGYAIDRKGSPEAFPSYRDHRASELGLESGHCKVFMESDDVGRTLDLSVFGSYEELYGRLSDMFGIEKSKMMNHVFYKDVAGAVKHTRDEPFSDFMKTARRLMILTDSGSR
ncbi:auxin response factor 18 isoform X3 [Musa acuminata AAA Group]|uniref:auxin response factor 18 isoform X3 n=1 Tax=Musa acuminata AAA Group TaxID=214697 RepID=UPI0031E07040